MSTENLFEVASEGTAAPRFNALESAAPSALKEFPLIPENRTVANDSIGLGLYDPSQNQPFEITDGQGRVIATAPDSGDRLYDITDGSIGSSADVNGQGPFGCSSCGCQEYTVSGWNRNQFFARNQYASFNDDDGEGDGYDPGDEYDPDDGDYCPDDDGGGGCGPGGGLGFLRGLFSRFGRGGLLRGLFGGGGMRFGRFLRF